jgi:hypothetical protein
MNVEWKGSFYGASVDGSVSNNSQFVLDTSMISHVSAKNLFKDANPQNTASLKRSDDSERLTVEQIQETLYSQQQKANVPVQSAPQEVPQDCCTQPKNTNPQRVDDNVDFDLIRDNLF